VSRVDELDLPAFRKRREHGDVGVAAQSEDVLDAASFQVLDQLMGDEVLHDFSSIPASA
jgi:hypothetical protein